MLKFLRTFAMAAMLLLPFASQAQLNTYLFSTGVDNTMWYTLTNDSTVLKVGSGNDSYATPVTNIGFTFNLAGTDYTQFSANSDGTLRFGSTAVGTGSYTTPLSATNAGTYAPKVCGLGCDGWLPTGGYIAYQLFGTEGSRVLVVEISTRTYNQRTSVEDQYLTFQIQLAEADNSITLMYSPTAPTAAPGVSYQLGASTSATDVVLFNVADNTMSALTAGTSTNNASGTWPAAGRYYKVEPNPNACFAVTDLAASGITTNSVTLTWADTMNTGATYTVYGADNSVIASNVTATTYTVTGLNANTAYTFRVVANCSADNASNETPISVRTACDVTTPLPYSEDFSGYTGLPSTPYYGPAVTPACWDYYSNGTNTAETSGSTSYYGGVAQYSSTSSYACLVASDPYLIMPIYLVGSAVTSQTYINYAAARGTTKIAILPAFVEALNTLQISFDYKMSSSYSSTSYASTLELGYVTGNDYTFTSMQSWNATSTKQSIEELNLSSLAANAPAGARLAFKFSGVHNGTGTSSYGAVYCGIDNVVVESLPNCLRVSDVTASNITTNSATIAWIDTLNTGASYTIYNMADTSVVASNISTLTHTVTGLNANTEYQFGVVANCSATDVSEATLVTFRTACASETMPWSEDFNNWTAKSPCWSFLSGQYNGGAGTPTASTSAWTLNSTYGDYITIDGKALTMNLYSSNKYWAVTPNIEINNNNAVLSVDVAVAAWSAATPNYDDNDTLAFAISTNDGTTWTTLQVVDYTELNSMGGTYSTITIPVTGYNGQTVRFAIYGGSTSGTSPHDNRIAFDNVSVEVAPSCMPVAGLVASNITADGATLTWTGNAASYNVYNMADTTLVANTTNTSYTFTDLAGNTQYTFGVSAVCSSTDESAIVSASFRTDCAPYPLPFTEDFTNNLSSDPCWAGATGVTFDSLSNGGVLTLTANSQWVYSSSTSNGLDAGHYRVNIYGSSCKKWMITPEIDLTTAASPSLTFDAAFTTYSGSSVATGFENNASQKFMVLASTNNGQSWAMVSDIALSTLASTTYIPQTVDLTAYAGQIVRLAFYAQSTTSGGDNNLHVDNISVVSGGTIPTQVLTINMSANDATMGTTTPAPGTYTYNAGDSVIFTAIPNAGYHFVSWNIDYSDYGMGVLPISDSITLAIPVAAEDLGSEFDIIATFAIDATACTAVAIPFTEDFEANSTTAACWTTSNTNSSTGINSGSPYTGSQAFRFYYSTNPPQYLISPELSGTTDGVNVSFMYKAQSTSYTETFHVGYSTTTNDTSAFTWGPEISTNMPTWLPYSGTMPAGTKYVAVKYTAYDQYYLFIDSVVFDNPPACMPVTALTVYATTANSVTLNWNGTATSYSIYNGSTLVADNITTTNYTISGLTASTGYTFGVVANCGTETSTMETIDARTDCGDGSCAIQIDGIDSYGDGWDGATITVSQNGFTLGTFTVVGSTNTVQYSVCSGIPVTFTWTGSTSSYSYPDEISFEIKDGSGMVGYLLSDATNTANGVIYTMNDPCPSCVAPIVTLDSVTTTDAYISWTGNATSYSVYNGSTFVTNTTANTYTFTGLTAGTTYTFGVVAICSADDSSAMATVSVTTEFDCSDITTLPYNYGFESGLACWTTVNGSADGVAWMTTNLAGMTNVAPHGGSQVASSWSWNSTAMHANAWLISPKFVLPTVAAGDSLTFSWWEVANANYADSYSVKISTTTNDTTAFTVTARPSTAAAGSWTQQTIDLTAYAGQSVYVAFHHVDYDMNYLLIDDIELFQGAYVPPAPDTLTVTVATMDATMGTTNPAPGTYQYAETETVQLSGVPNSGYHFIGWAYTTDGVNNDTLDADYITVQFPASLFMSTGSVTFTALFEAGNPDSTTVTYAVNDATMGTTIPAPGTYTAYVGSAVQAEAIANNGYAVAGWVLGIYDAQNTALQEDTLYAFDEEFANPMNFGTVPQSFADNGYTITVTALFNEGTVEPQEFTLITAVNDATMGTITPAPGTHTYVAGDSILFGFTAAEGYTIGSVDITMSIMDQTIMDTTLPALYAIAMAQEPLYADDFLGMTMSLTVNFVADTNSSSDVFTLVTAVNNATMGTMTPAPGTHTYNAGDVINFTVTANEGYAFESATMSISYMGTTLQEETVYDLEFTTEPLEIDEEMLGFTMTVTVNFKSTQGIENADEANIYAYSKNGNIVLNGAEGREVYVFDINGRNLHHTVKATATETYNVPATGVYLVKVIGGETIRVVVMR